MDAPADLLLLVLSHGLAFTGYLVLVAAVGRRCLAGLEVGDRAGEAGLAVAVGTGVLGTALLGLGLAGWLTPAGLGVLVAAAAVVCGPSFWRWARRLVAEGAARLLPKVAITAALTAPMFVLTLYPPAGWDANTYHLPYARAFVETGGVPFLGQLRFPIFPQLHELLFALATTGAGDLLAKATQVAATLGTGALLLWWGRLTASPRVASWAAALWIGHPIVIWIGASAYVDASVALHATAAFATWERWRTSGETRWLLLAGACAGFAAAGKYLGLFVIAGLAVMTLARFRRTEGGRMEILRSVAAFCLAACLVAAPWYLRIAAHTGNPLFPFYPAIFGESGWQAAADRGVPVSEDGGLSGAVNVATHHAREMVEGIGFLVSVPWRGVFDREVFDFQAPLSPWLMLVWVAFPAALFDRHRLRWTLFLGAYGLFWLTTVRDLRFLMMVLPLASLWTVQVLDSLLEGRKVGDVFGRHWRLVALALLLPGWLYGAYKITEAGPIPATEMERHDYLEQRLPAYGAARWLDEHADPGSRCYGLYAERLHYAAGRRWLGNRFGPERFEHVVAAGRQGRLVETLRGFGADYLLVVEDPREQPLLGLDDPRLSEAASGEGWTLYRLTGGAPDRERGS